MTLESELKLARRLICLEELFREGGIYVRMDILWGELKIPESMEALSQILSYIDKLKADLKRAEASLHYATFHEDMGK